MKKLCVLMLLALPLAGCSVRVLPDGSFEAKADTNQLVNVLFTYAEKRAPLELQFEQATTEAERDVIRKKLDVLDTTVNQILMGGFGWLEKVKISNMEIPPIPTQVISSYPGVATPAATK